MSLNRPVVALGALVVVALGIVGGEVAYAAGQSKPAPFVSISQGNTYQQAEPACYNGGKTLTTADLKTCTASKKNTTVISIGTGGTTPAIGLSDTGAAAKGWFLVSGGQAITSSYHSTYEHLNLGSLFTNSSTGTTTSTITLQFVEGDATTGATYGVWNFTLNKKAS